MPKIIHLDENHELLKNELEKLGFKNYFDLISTKKRGWKEDLGVSRHNSKKPNWNW